MLLVGTNQTGLKLGISKLSCHCEMTCFSILKILISCLLHLVPEIVLVLYNNLFPCVAQLLTTSTIYVSQALLLSHD